MEAVRRVTQRSEGKVRLGKRVQRNLGRGTSRYADYHLNILAMAFHITHLVDCRLKSYHVAEDDLIGSNEGTPSKNAKLMVMNAFSWITEYPPLHICHLDHVRCSKSSGLDAATVLQQTFAGLFCFRLRRWSLFHLGRSDVININFTTALSALILAEIKADTLFFSAVGIRLVDLCALG